MLTLVALNSLGKVGGVGNVPLVALIRVQVFSVPEIRHIIFFLSQTKIQLRLMIFLNL